MGIPSPVDLANAVSAYAMILAGVTGLLLASLMQRQPLRWMAVYAGVVVTGMATVWFHGFGEQFFPSVVDIGTNLLLAWLLQNAVLGDYYAPRTRHWIIAVSGIINLTFVIWKYVIQDAYYRIYAIPLGASGGFRVGEVILISNSLLVTLLFYLRRKRIPDRARPLLYVVTATFIFGTLLAGTSNHEVGYQVLAYHATWHIVGAFGFVFFWAFNHVRFSEEPTLSRPVSPPSTPRTEQQPPSLSESRM